MKVLVAEDDPLVLHLLRRLLESDYEVITATDGRQAWDVLSQKDGPRLAVVDWQMPGLDGTAICRRARALKDTAVYVVLVTATHKRPEDLLAGFDAGADDYITKPFDPDELRARVAVGRRVLELQRTLAERVSELQGALARVHRLENLLSICSWCKRICNEQNCWEQLETYLSQHSGATFTHVICPDCCEKVRAEEAAEVQHQS